MAQVNLYEAKTHLSQLIDAAVAGQEVVIAKAGRPKVRLVAVVEEQAARPFGLYAGQIWVADDFDDPLPEDILTAFTGHEP